MATKLAHLLRTHPLLVVLMLTIALAAALAAVHVPLGLWDGPVGG